MERFVNENILAGSNTPVDKVEIYNQADTERMVAKSVNLNRLDLDFESIRNISPITEFHVYSSDNRIHSGGYPSKYNQVIPNNLSSNNPNPSYNLIVTPEKDVRESGVSRGTYSIVYNFMQKFTPEMKINRVSSDATEVELLIDPNDSRYLKTLYEHFVNGVGNLTLSNPAYKRDFALNFGNDDIYPIVGMSFENNEKVGEIVYNAEFPTSSFNNSFTRFYPVSKLKGNFSSLNYDPSFENLNEWVELRYVDEGLNFSTFPYMESTGRTAKFTIASTPNGKPYWKQEEDLNGDPIFYTHDNSNEDRRTAVPPELIFRAREKPTFSKVRVFDPSLKDTNKLVNVVVKLYSPLRSDLEVKEPTIDRFLRESYIERILVYPSNEKREIADFSPPNFDADVGEFGKSNGTEFKNWNNLLDASLNTSQQIVDKYISGSFYDKNINIDYSDFENFVHFSSAKERVENFKYKLQLIESYDSRISTLTAVSGAEALSNISQSIDRKNKVVSGMDGFEKWLYYEETGSLYTHYSSSNYVFEPWPKRSRYPLANYSVSSSQGVNYFNGLYASASYFDSKNEARLTHHIPAAIAEDQSNDDYLLFINMVGHHFDISWAYINKLTSINSREEHPYDGMPNNLLYDVAKSMGWKLTNGEDTSDLWKYALGTDKFGNPLQSGSLASKSNETINYEIWRRVVNTIPYLLKTKGTARGIKALLSTYGIPQTFLSIREYGGPAINEVKPYWEHEKFVYHLRFFSDNYLTAPWDKINDINPNTYSIGDPNPIDAIELSFQANFSQTTALFNKGDDFAVILEPTASKTGRGNIHFYLSGSGGYKSASINDVMVFDSKMSNLVLQRGTSVDDITQDNTYTLHYRRSRKDKVVIRSSASISVNGTTEPSYNAAWTGSGTLTVGNGNLTTTGTPSLWSSTNFLSGSIQELRYWGQPLVSSVIDDHTLARQSYHGNTHTSSFFDLKFRFIPDSQIKTVSASYDGYLSQHPNQQVSQSENGNILSASLFNFASSDLRGVTDEYYTAIPSAGANNILSNKIRLEDSSLTGVLDPDNKKERSIYDTAPVDSNRLGVYLAATNMYNEDIYNHTGYFQLDDYIGNPDQRAGYNDEHEELNFLRRQVFRKYSSKNLINDTIDILARYNLSVFDQIAQLIPARVDYNSGILVEPHILERPKVKARTGMSHNNNEQLETRLAPATKSISGDVPYYTASINNIASNITGDSPYYTSSIRLITNSDITAVTSDIISVGSASAEEPYAASVYQYTLLIRTGSNIDVGYGAGWTTSSNGYWRYRPLAAQVTGSRLSNYALKEVYFYSTAESASLNLANSSSLVPAEVQDEKPLAINNLRYLGCRISSDSITTNSDDTPDGRPVVEVFQADPNNLIYTTQTGDEGNLDVDSNTNLQILSLDDLHVGSHIKWQRMNEYNKELREFRKKLEQLNLLESVRRKEFDRLYEEQQKELLRDEIYRDEFDIINRSGNIIN